MLGELVRVLGETASSAAGSLRWAEGVEGPLHQVPGSARAFHPGTRTADVGRLGAVLDGEAEPHDGASVTIRLPLAEFDGSGGRQSVQRVRWLLRSGLGVLPPSERGPNDAVFANDPLDTAEDAFEQTRDEHLRGGMTIQAGEPGPWRLYVQLVAADGTVLHRGRMPLSVPRHVPVLHGPTAVDGAMDAAGVPVAARAALWDRIIERAEPIAAHLLRSCNVRLWWLAGTLPGDIAAPGSAEELWWRAERDLPAPLQTGRDNAFVAGRPLSTEAARHVVRVAAPGTAVRPRTSVYRGLFGRPDPAWRVELGAGAGIVRVGLGGLAFDNRGASDGDSADQVLAAVAAEAAAVGFRDGHEVTDWWVELNARVIAVGVARLATAPLGGGTLAPSGQHPEPDPNGPMPVGADLLDPAPSVPVRQLLGLHQPGDVPVAEVLRAADSDAPVGLVAQTRQPDGHDPSRQWTDLVTYHHRHLGLDEARMRHPDGRRMTAYDVLSSLIRDESLARAERRLPLGAAYGGYPLTFDDADEQLRYGGAVRVAVTGDDRRHVSDLQYDLRLIGVSLGLHTSGEMGPRRLAAPDPNDLAARRRLMRGSTEWAVREFQIARGMPNDVRAGLAPVTAYAHDLHVVATDDTLATNDGQGVVPTVTGSVDAATAADLRRWRFARRRYPVVMEARTAPSAAHDGPGPIIDAQSMSPTNPVAGQDEPAEAPDNLMSTNALQRNAPVVYVVDLSGIPSQPAPTQVDGIGRHPLGQWVQQRDRNQRPMWSGPRVYRSQAQRPLTVAHALGDDWDPTDLSEDDPRRAPRERAVEIYKTVAPTAQEESQEHYDILQAYDRAVVSLPLLHYTAGLGPHGEGDGQLGGFADFLASGLALADDLRLGDAAAVVDERLKAIAWRLFGRYGTTAVPVRRGLTNIDEATPLVLDGRVDHSDESRASVQWFRTWPWIYRFVRAIRHDEDLRTAMYAYAVRRLAQLRTWRHGNRHVTARHTSQRAMAVVLRQSIFRPADARFVAGLIQPGDTQDQIIARHLGVGWTYRDGLIRALSWDGGPDAAFGPQLQARYTVTRRDHHGLIAPDGTLLDNDGYVLETTVVNRTVVRVRDEDGRFIRVTDPAGNPVRRAPQTQEITVTTRLSDAAGSLPTHEQILGHAGDLLRRLGAGGPQ